MPPQVDRALALLGVGTAVLDMDLTEAAVEADLLLRDDNPSWVPVESVPSTYQPPRDGWLTGRDSGGCAGNCRECVALRRSMYTPDKGTWYDAYIRLDHKGPYTGELTTRFDYERRPFAYWGPDEIELVHQDHELYPRDAEDMPEWHPLRPREPDDLD